MRELESDPDIVKFTPMRVPQSLEQTTARLKSQIEKQSTYDPLGIWLAETKASREFLGWFMLIPTGLEFPELGFMMSQKHWGKSLTPEIARAVLAYGSQVSNLKGVMARTNPNNTRSIRALEKLGFVFKKLIVTPDKVLGREIELNLYHLDISKL